MIEIERAREIQRNLVTFSYYLQWAFVFHQPHIRFCFSFRLVKFNFLLNGLYFAIIFISFILYILTQFSTIHIIYYWHSESICTEEKKKQIHFFFCFFFIYNLS